MTENTKEAFGGLSVRRAVEICKDEFGEKGTDKSPDVRAYMADIDFIKACVLYSSLSSFNKTKSFLRDTGIVHRNQFSLDTSVVYWSRFDKNGNLQEIPQTTYEELPMSERFLREMESDGAIRFDAEEIELKKAWELINASIHHTLKYTADFTYNPYQIRQELVLTRTVHIGDKEETHFRQPHLVDELNSLDEKVKAYFLSHLKDKMKKYNLIE